MLSLVLALGTLAALAARSEPLLRPLPVAPALASAAPGLAERSTSLSELRAAPGTNLGQEVRFVLQFQRLVEDWNPYLSRFEPARWLALEAWPDELFTWDKRVFDAPVGHLFLRRGGGFEPIARRARTYQRFEVHGRVREVFLGEPWIEIEELVPLSGEVGEGTILHVTRAREVALQGQFDLALEQYERARGGPLPPHALAALLAEIHATEEARLRAEPEAPAAKGKKSGAAPGS